MKKRFFLLIFIPFLMATQCEDDLRAIDCIDSSLIDEKAICTEEYAPVCGCNEVTYSNLCKAKVAGITTFSNGACD